MTSSGGGPRLSRRRLLQAAGIAGAGAALPLATGCAIGDDEKGEPENVVLIIIDSLRPDFVGAYGAPQMRTPNLDALLAKGLRFNRAFPEALVTVPARRSIFTGQRIFPYRDFKPVADLGVSPGWTGIDDLDPSRVIHVGDAHGYDVAGARAAGVVPVFVDPHRLHADPGCLTVGSLAEVVSLLDRR